MLFLHLKCKYPPPPLPANNSTISAFGSSQEEDQINLVVQSVQNEEHKGAGWTQKEATMRTSFITLCSAQTCLRDLLPKGDLYARPGTFWEGACAGRTQQDKAGWTLVPSHESEWSALLSRTGVTQSVDRRFHSRKPLIAGDI